MFSEHKNHSGKRTETKAELREMLFFIHHEGTIRNITSPEEIRADTDPKSIMACVNISFYRKVIADGETPKGVATLKDANHETLQAIKDILQERLPRAEVIQADQGLRLSENAKASSQIRTS